MMDYSQISDIVRQQTRKAKKAGRKPASIREYTGENYRAFIRRIPFLGDYVPTGWEVATEIESLFVDKTGLGGSDEPALNLDQFKRKLDNFKLSGDNFGFGIIEEGEFQVYIQVYRPDRRDFTHTGALTNEELNRVRSK